VGWPRRDAQAQGLRILTARGGELERDFAYGVVRQLLERSAVDADATTRAALLAGPAAHAARALELEDGVKLARPAEDQAFAVRHGLYWLVANLAADGPLLVAVDDVQWADAASLRFLAYLARRLEGLPVLVAITARNGDPTTDEQLLSALIDDPAAQRLTPAPLSVDATRELLGGKAGGVEEAFAATCHAATGGNPFLLHELRSALARDGIAPLQSNAHRVTGLGPSTVARSLILRRPVCHPTR